MSVATPSPAALAAPGQTAPFRPAQTVLVMQGGGALGAFHQGVYQALHEGGREPDWVIGTSIGAINAALIAGNPPEDRLARLQAFWQRVLTDNPLPVAASWWPGAAALAQWQQRAGVVAGGIPGFFVPRVGSWINPQQPVGIEAAAYYDTGPLRETLNELVDFDYLRRSPVRITVGAVNARTGQMRYFDSRDEPIAVEHILASGALAPAFGAVRIDGDPYWDGGLYSNTPIEAVLDDQPRRHSLIFACQLWEPHGDEPRSLWEVQERLKDIQFASRAQSHLERQQQLHHLRHILRQLARKLPNDPEAQALSAWGCSTVMQIVNLMVPHLPGEDQTKDIDFSPQGVRQRTEAGLALGRQALLAQPWNEARAPLDGVCIHPVHLD